MYSIISVYNQYTWHIITVFFFNKFFFALDFGKPVIGNLSDHLVKCGDPISPKVLGYPSVNDSLDSNPFVSFVDRDVSSGCTTSRLWTATDHAGNQATVEQFIHSVSLLPIKVRLFLM